MGIFAAASIKAQTQKAGPTPEPMLGRPPELKPLPSQAVAAGLVVAPALEGAMDLLWARLRGPNIGPNGLTHKAFVLAHWEPDEGATTIAAALATRAAQLDQTCTFCLADFDFFNPGLSFLTGLEADRGLSNVLCSQTALEKVLASTRLPNHFPISRRCWIGSGRRFRSCWAGRLRTGKDKG